MEAKDQLEDELGQYENRWVAILESEKRIVGSGDTASQIKGESESNGYTETTLFRVPRAGRYCIYSL